VDLKFSDIPDFNMLSNSAYKFFFIFKVVPKHQIVAIILMDLLFLHVFIL